MFAQRLIKVLNKPRSNQRARTKPSHRAIASSASSASNDRKLNRRELALLSTTLLLQISTKDVDVAHARDRSNATVLVIGATGQTGKLVVKKLSERSGVNVIAGCRSLEKAKKMNLDQNGVELLGQVDVTDTVENLALAMDGVDVLVIATGFVPGNPFKMNAAAHEVDNLGVVNAVNAAKRAKSVKKIVLISSILTNGREAGFADSPGFKITNAFGQVLDEKLVGERYLRNSGIDWVIVRPAGLKNETSGKLIIGAEDAMSSGEINRALVAEVMAEAATNVDAKNKVYEIAEEGSYSNGYDCGAPKCSIKGSDKSKWFSS
jgi:uncharacterized protein YbjT (DUF2867 family)